MTGDVNFFVTLPNFFEFISVIKILNVDTVTVNHYEAKHINFHTSCHILIIASVTGLKAVHNPIRLTNFVVVKFVECVVENNHKY